MNQVKSNLNPFTTTVPKLERITDKYQFISTKQFIEDVQSFGYKLEETKQPRSGLGMHSMSFSHPSMPQADGLNMRLLATNSHDASSAFHLYIQVLVQVCSNGLVAWRADKDADIRIVHRGYAIDKVKNAVEVIKGKFDSVLNTIDAMQAKDVTPEHAAEFLRKSIELRDAKPFKILDLQYPKHAEQSENTAWNVFNRVQESLIKGGYNTLETLDNGFPSPFAGRKAKELTSIKDKVKINTKLWELAVETLLNK